MGVTFLAGLGWLFCAGTACLYLARRFKRLALDLLCRGFGPGFGLAFYAALTLPGFFLHEGAHALAAIALRVPIRGVTWIPRPSPDHLAVGASVQVIPRDPLRMALIALAPLLAGTVVLGLLSGALGLTSPDPRPWVRLDEWAGNLHYDRTGLWAMAYLMWSIGSHMAPSADDMPYVRNGALSLLGALLVGGLFLAFLGAEAAASVGLVLGRFGDGLALGAILNGVFWAPLALLAYFLRRK